MASPTRPSIVGRARRTISQIPPSRVVRNKEVAIRRDARRPVTISKTSLRDRQVSPRRHRQERDPKSPPRHRALRQATIRTSWVANTRRRTAQTPPGSPASASSLDSKARKVRPVSKAKKANPDNKAMKVRPVSKVSRGSPVDSKVASLASKASRAPRLREEKGVNRVNSLVQRRVPRQGSPVARAKGRASSPTRGNQAPMASRILKVVVARPRRVVVETARGTSIYRTCLRKNSSTSRLAPDPSLR